MVYLVQSTDGMTLAKGGRILEDMEKDENSSIMCTEGCLLLLSTCC
jgi:hypothetical protein